MYLLNKFHIVSLVCFLIYGIKSRSGHKNHKIVNKHIKGIKSIGKYKRGFAIRTCLLLTP